MTRLVDCARAFLEAVRASGSDVYVAAEPVDLTNAMIDGQVDVLQATRAVVEALRMPSLAMIEACFDACKSEVSHQNLVTAWRAMLDAILNETCAEPPVPP